MKKILFLLFLSCFTALNAQYPIVMGPKDSMYSDVRETFGWKHVLNGNAYRIEIDTTTLFNSAAKHARITTFPVIQLPDQTSLEIPDSTLYFGTTYYWRIKTLFASDSSEWSPADTFVTRNAPTVTYPINDQFTYPQAFIVTHIDGATAYNLEVNTDPIFTNPIYIITTVQDLRPYSTGDPININVGNYTIGQEYYWRIRAISAIDTSAWGDTLKFTAAAGNSVVELKSPLSIYPNPASDFVQIVNNGSPVLVKLFDTQERLIAQYYVNGSTIINTSHLSEGLYYLQYSDENGKIAASKLLIGR